jgi:hypothetical protein
MPCSTNLPGSTSPVSATSRDLKRWRRLQSCQAWPTGSAVHHARLRHSHGEILEQGRVGRRRIITDHVVSERRDDRDASIRAAVQVAGQVVVVQMLVDVGDDHPISITATGLPAGVRERLLGEDERIRHSPGEAPHFDSRMGVEHGEGTVRGSVVVDEVAVDDGIVVPEEEGQHARVVPALRVQVHRHFANSGNCICLASLVSGFRWCWSRRRVDRMRPNATDSLVSSASSACERQPVSRCSVRPSGRMSGPNDVLRR